MVRYTIIPPRRLGKKYSVLKDGKYLLSFGSTAYQHFKDSTPLKLWSHLDHGDRLRRQRYYQRHGYTDNKDSAKYWANRYLWT